MEAQPTDAELVLAARFGEQAARRDAYSQLVLRYEGMIRAMLTGLTGSRAIADELAQESFLTAWLELDNLKDIARYGAWLKQIAYRKFLHAVRRNKTEQKFADSLHEDDTVELWSGDLERILKLVTSEERELLLLTYGFGFTIDELSRALGKPAGTIKSTISRAKQSIREQLATTVAENSYG